jgi:hypothetical protein
MRASVGITGGFPSAMGLQILGFIHSLFYHSVAHIRINGRRHMKSKQNEENSAPSLVTRQPLQLDNNHLALVLFILPCGALVLCIIFHVFTYFMMKLVQISKLNSQN